LRRLSFCSLCPRHLSKNKEVIFHLVTISNLSTHTHTHIYNRERLNEIWRMIQFYRRNTTLSEPLCKTPHNQLTSNYVYWGEIASYIKLRLILISFAFNSRFNSATETQLLVNHRQTTSEFIETSNYVYWGWDRIIYQIWDYSDNGFLRC
jgi:hypothetical protein